MTDRDRYRTWYRARLGNTDIVLGTRSAVFTPLKNPGLIIVDEEHDHSFKQMDGFRYHARDLAVMRASLENIPIVLGSATPSMETHRNAASGKFNHMVLSKRIGKSSLPRIDIVDTRIHKSVNGLTSPLAQAIGKRLEHGQQSILFINNY